MAGAAASKYLRHLRRSSPSFFISRRPSSSPAPIDTSHVLCSSHCPLPSTKPRFQSNRCFSASSSGENSDIWLPGEWTAPRSGLDEATSSGLNEVAHGVLNSSTDGGSILPVKPLISLLDYYHDFTGLPWWAVIASSTLAMRLTLFPVVVLQQKKLHTIAGFMPKLPPPLPPLFSGKSYVDHISNFRKERRASGCPSLWWMLASPAVQVPFFILWMVTTRKMSLGSHPGFDCGGILWFQNLTEVPQGVIGLILPLMIGGLHYTNVQVSFSRFRTRSNPDMIGVAAKVYKKFLEFMSLVIVCGSCWLPQGSLVYWITNLSSSILLQTILHHPDVRMKLGLSNEQIISKGGLDSDKTVTSNLTGLFKTISLASNGRRSSVQDFSPTELLSLSVQVISQGNKIEGISLLELALEKDPGYVKAMVILGQTLLQIEEPDEATEYLERAVSKIIDADDPLEKEGEELDLLILASQWAGVAYIRQSKWAEGLVHLERIATLKEPEEPKIKAHYYDGLILLASALSNKGRTTEAAKYLRLAAAYDSKYKELLEQCEKDEVEKSQ